MESLSRCRRCVSTAIALSVIVLVPQLLFANTLYFPHVVVGGDPDAGGRYTTNFVIMNIGTSAAFASVVFYNQDGSINSMYQRSINIPVGGSTRFTLPGPESERLTRVMWARITAGTGTVQGVATFERRAKQPDGSIRLVSTAGVLGTDAPGNSFVLPVDVMDPIFNTGVAIANVSSSPVNVQLGFRLEDGSVLGDPQLEPLGPYGQFANFVTKWFSSVPGTTQSGALIIEAATGTPPNSLAVVALTENEGLDAAIPVIPGGQFGITGVYDLTFTASPACTNLPNEPKTRKYTATVTRYSPPDVFGNVRVTLSDSTFAGPQGYCALGDRFWGTIANDAARFEIETNSVPPCEDWGGLPAIIEWIAPGSYFGIKGNAQGSMAEGTISGQVEGSFLLHGRNDFFGPPIAACQGGHTFVMRRR